jgi:hypothetical protein
MTKDFEPAKAVLRRFLSEIDALKKIRQQISAPILTVFGTEMPSLEGIPFAPAPDSHYEKDDAYIWIHGATRYFPLMLREPLNFSVPEFYSQPAQNLYKKWQDVDPNISIDILPTSGIPKPARDETLINYIGRLRTEIESGENRKRWWRSFASFVNFIRKDTRLIEIQGTLNSFFPEKMAIHGGVIVRKVPLTLYPVDILVASEIVQGLVSMTLEARSDVQEAAAQALGLTLICLAAGERRLQTRVDVLHQTLIGGIRKEDKPDDPFAARRFLPVRTYFGKVDMPISNTVHDYLVALPRGDSPHLFTLSIQTLRKHFNRAVSKIKRAEGLGKITFLTLMSQSHQAIGQRFKGYSTHLHRPYE